MKKNTLTLTTNAAVATTVTHPAPHHGDETMALAMLAILEGKVNVLRTRNPKEIEAAAEAGAYIVDVGGRYDGEQFFDHHQRDFAEARDDETKYSSAGLIWRAFGAVVCVALTGCNLPQAEAAAKAVEEALVKGIDLADYGVRADGQMSVSQAIAGLNLNWDETDGGDEMFLEACQMAQFILERTIRHAVAAEKGKDATDEAIRASEGSIMTLPCYVTGWLERTVASEDPRAKELLYGIFRNLQGQWNVQAIPPSLEEGSSQRKPLPEAWRGKSPAELAEITGVEDAVFCHPAGFICGARSREGAIRLAEIAISS